MISNKCNNYSLDGGLPPKSGRYTSHHTQCFKHLCLSCERRRITWHERETNGQQCEKNSRNHWMWPEPLFSSITYGYLWWFSSQVPLDSQNLYFVPCLWMLVVILISVLKSLYMISWSCQYASSLFLNVFIVFALTTWMGREFHICLLIWLRMCFYEWRVLHVLGIFWGREFLH